MAVLETIITITSSSLVTFALSIAAFKYNLLKIKANATQEVEKSEQEKISTAEGAIDLVNKLRETMNEEFIIMRKDKDRMRDEIGELKTQLQEYQRQCSTCQNNKIK